MLKYILKRFTLALIALTIIVVVVYFLINLSERNPVDSTNFTEPGEYERVIKRLGLDKSTLERFIIYIQGIFKGEFGLIFNKGQGDVRTIPELFFGPLKYTLWVTIPTFIFSAVLGIVLGFVSGYNNGKPLDAVINIFVVFFMGVPSFLLAAFVLTMGDKIGLPVAFIRPEDQGIAATISSLILPVLLMTFTSLVGYTYYTRNEVISILGTNQVQIARSKGLDEWSVFTKHVLRNASIPLVSMLIPSFLYLLAGSFVIEQFFQIPGTSYEIVSAISNAEYNIIMFNTLFFTTLGLMTNILVDVTYVIIDPRIRYAAASSFEFIERTKASAKRNAHFNGKENVVKIGGNK